MEYRVRALQPLALFLKSPLRMYLSLSGLFYLANLWNALRTTFNLPIPDVCVTMGFPSRRARTRASLRSPGEILVTEWKGSNIEKALVSIHPERFENVEQVALATLFVIGNEVYGSRRNLGSQTLGVSMNRENGDLVYTADDKGVHAKSTLHNITKALGSIPQGFADMPEPKARQATRMLKYACSTCSTIIRNAGGVLSALCMHAGTAQVGQPAAPFIIAPPRTRTQRGSRTATPSSQPVAQAPAPAAQVLTAHQENVVNAAKLVRGGAAKVVHGRMFGEAATA